MSLFALYWVGISLIIQIKPESRKRIKTRDSHPVSQISPIMKLSERPEISESTIRGDERRHPATLQDIPGLHGYLFDHIFSRKASKVVGTCWKHFSIARRRLKSYDYGMTGEDKGSTVIHKDIIVVGGGIAGLTSITLGIEDNMLLLDGEESLRAYAGLLRGLYLESADEVARIILAIHDIIVDMKVLYGVDNPLFTQKKKPPYSGAFGNRLDLQIFQNDVPHLEDEYALRGLS
jgi:hypothetical protein